MIQGKVLKMFGRRGAAARALRRKADAARDAKQWPAAAVLYDAYLSECPNDAAIWVQLGHAQKEAGHDEEAMRAYQSSLALAPDVADTHLQIGHLLKKLGRVEEAAASYAASMQKDGTSGLAEREFRNLRPDGGDGPGASPDLLLSLADAARDKGRWAAAAEHYAAYVDLRQGDSAVWPIWVQLAHARKEAGDSDGAVTAYEHAIKLHPEAAETHLHLAHLFKAMGAVDAAVASFVAAFRLDPELTEADRERSALMSQAEGVSARHVDTDGVGILRLAYPLPLSPEQVAFSQTSPAIYTGLSRRFSH